MVGRAAWRGGQWEFLLRVRKYKRVDLVYRKEACGLLALPDLRGQETRLEFQVSLEEPELHPMGKGHLGKARRSCYPGLDRDRTQLAQGQGAAWKKDGGFTLPHNPGRN